MGLTTQGRDQRAVIFDLDGLSVDTELLWEKVERDFLAARGRIYLPKVAAQHIGLRLNDIITILKHAYKLCEGEQVLRQELLNLLMLHYNYELRLKEGYRVA